MENLLDYLLYALFGHEVTSVHTNIVSGSSFIKVKSWTICFENAVYITIDETDLQVIHSLYNERYDRLDEEERARYLKIFNACI